jgi:hypothetical protein
LPLLSNLFCPDSIHSTITFCPLLCPHFRLRRRHSTVASFLFPISIFSTSFFLLLRKRISIHVLRSALICSLKTLPFLAYSSPPSLPIAIAYFFAFVESSSITFSPSILLFCRIQTPFTSGFSFCTKLCFRFQITTHYNHKLLVI